MPDDDRPGTRVARLASFLGKRIPYVSLARLQAAAALMDQAPQEAGQPVTGRSA
jgi:hypothetical protein